MPRITLRETITKKIEIPMETLYELIENFKKAKIQAILADFAATGLYEDDFMKDLEEGLKKS
jgi:hypothetical protein